MVVSVDDWVKSSFELLTIVLCKCISWIAVIVLFLFPKCPLPPCLPFFPLKSMRNSFLLVSDLSDNLCFGCPVSVGF